MTKFDIEKPKNFDISQIFDCGQCFRFNRTSFNEYEGVAFDKYIKVLQTDTKITFFGITESDYKKVWHNFFDLDFDYQGVAKSFSDDKTLFDAYNFCSGIRILNQDKWEALCSFIISQNNNIPRIKGIIENLSKKYGNEIYKDGDKSFYSFPTPERLYAAGEEEIFALKTGFRAKYIYDASKKICENPSFLDEVSSLPTSEASLKLQEIKGVGPKVAACTLLFAFSRKDAFPIDVWVKKILKEYYPCGVSGHLAGEYAGIAQQYLFYYERCKNNVFI